MEEDDLTKYLLTKEDANKIARDFKIKAIKFLKKNRKNMIILKGAPTISAFSTTFGPYIGKQFALYLSKNSLKKKLR